ncbi:MAG: hypothetical protein ACFFBI_05650 [Promethearchaeota archaeon]
MKIGKIDIGRQGNFILAILLLYFLFFGYVCNAKGKNIGMQLIFLYQVLFNPTTFLSFIILFAIVFIMASRENFFEYAIRNSIWLIPAIVIMSWIWYWFIYGFDIRVIYIYFYTVEGLLTIVSLLCTNLLAAILASIIKERRKLEKKVLIEEVTQT